jgi:hypothetical protein
VSGQFGVDRSVGSVFEGSWSGNRHLMKFFAFDLIIAARRRG